jgi:hypothetical protein
MMRAEQKRELEVLSDAEACPELRKYYSFKDDPELAATARRLGMEPVPQMIKISKGTVPGEPMIELIGITDSGRKRLRVLRARRAAEQRS